MNLTFLGASQTVTGSCYLLETEKSKILIDCGMFQGLDVFDLNYNEFKFDPKSIDALFLTHAHIDHCGLIPKLVKYGFRGEIFCTTPTSRLVELIFADSAKVQENNFFYRGVPALYDHIDSNRSIGLLKPVEFDRKLSYKDITFQFRFSSHILGAASVEIEAENKQICFSGDIGRLKPRIIGGFGEFTKNQDFIVMEALYGNKIHNIYEECIDKLANIVNNTLLRDGNVIIPVFSLHRSQEMIHILVKLLREGRINENVQIYFDSPLAKKLLEVYTSSISYFSDEFEKIVDPFGFNMNNIEYSKSSKKNLKMGKLRRSIILAGGGMLDGGRILEYLKYFISDRTSTLLFTGFQAEGTFGRELMGLPEEVTIDKRKHKVKIKIEDLNGLSAHADRNELKWWLSRFDKSQMKKIFLTHSEKEQSGSFKEFIEDEFSSIEVPKLYDSYIL